MRTAVPPASVASGRTSCRCATAESTCAHSGKLSSDIKVPEVIALRVWIRQVGSGYPKDTLANVRAACCSIAQLFPVIKLTASDYVVDCGKCPVRMIQMSMQHSPRIIAVRYLLERTHRNLGSVL